MVFHFVVDIKRSLVLEERFALFALQLSMIHFLVEREVRDEFGVKWKCFVALQALMCLWLRLVLDVIIKY